MSIGSGFSKHMIRGMGFNRVSVVEGGVKQEGQQWGADHWIVTLEIIHSLWVVYGASTFTTNLEQM